MVKEITNELSDNFLKTSFLLCKDLHDNSCIIAALDRLLVNFRSSSKLFIPLFFIPTIIFKRKLLKSTPILKETLQSCLRTLSFLSTWFSIWKYSLCKTKNIRMTVDGWNAIISGFLSGFSMLFETEGRASTVTLLMLPRVFETFWNLLRKRGLIKADSSIGQILLYGVIMGILNYFYQNDENAINHSYLKCFKKLWGVN